MFYVCDASCPPGSTETETLFILGGPSYLLMPVCSFSGLGLTIAERKKEPMELWLSCINFLKTESSPAYFVLGLMNGEYRLSSKISPL